MKSLHQKLLLLTLVLTLAYAASPKLPNDSQLKVTENNEKQPASSSGDTQIVRARRGYAKANKPGIFSLLSQLIAETQNDTREAYKKITDIFNENVVDERVTSTTPAAPVNGTTTQAPLRLTRQQLMRVLQRNLRGLARLFNREVDLAIKDSNRNVAKTRQDFREAVRPFLEPANITTTTTTTRRP